MPYHSFEVTTFAVITFAVKVSETTIVLDVNPCPNIFPVRISSETTMFLITNPLPINLPSMVILP